MTAPVRPSFGNQPPRRGGLSPDIAAIIDSELGPAPQPVGPIKGGARELFGGLTFEFEDEIEAGLRTGLGQLGDYEKTRDKIRAERAQFQRDNPFAAGALNVTGAVAPTVAAMVLSGGAAAPAAIPSLAARAARGAAAGAGTGALAGAGMAQEMEDIPANAALTGGIGGVLGGAAPVAFQAARGLGGRIADVAEGPVRAMAESYQPGTAALARGAAPTVSQAPATSALRNPFGYAATKALPALERRAQGRAEQKLLQALIDDGLTPDEAAQRLAAMQARGAPAAVADVGEENLLELTNTPFLVPGRGRQQVAQFFGDRVQGTSGRLAEGVERSANARMGNVKAMVREIDAARKEPARKLYSEAYAHGAVELDDEALDFVMTSDAIKAWNEGLRRSRLDALTDLDKKPLAPLYRIATNEAGEKVVDLLRDPTVRDIDIIKRGINALTDKARAKGDRDLARIFTQNIRSLLEKVDEQAPTYAEARRFWGGQQGLMNALDKGKKFLQGGADDFDDLVSDLTADELDMYRIGAANAIAEQLRRREGRAIAINILTDPTARQRLQRIYPDEQSFQMLQDIIEDEARMAGPYARMSRQSQTAQNLLNVLDFATDFRPGDITGDPKSMALRALMGLANAGQQRAQQSSAFQLSQLLTQQGPDAVAYLRSLQPRAAQQAARATGAATAQGRASGIIGGNLNERTRRR